jgi:hypothetical protein
MWLVKGEEWEDEGEEVDEEEEERGDNAEEGLKKRNVIGNESGKWR